MVPNNYWRCCQHTRMLSAAAAASRQALLRVQARVCLARLPRRHQTALEEPLFPAGPASPSRPHAALNDDNPRAATHVDQSHRPTEALVAVGLASNVLQLVSFGADLLSETRQIHSSVSGTTREFEDIEGVCRHAAELCAGLNPAPVPVSAPTKEEATLHSLASKGRSAASLMNRRGSGTKPSQRRTVERSDGCWTTAPENRTSPRFPRSLCSSDWSPEAARTGCLASRDRGNRP